MKPSRLCTAIALLIFAAWGDIAQAKDAAPAFAAAQGQSALAAPSADPAGAGLAKPGEEIPDWKARWELAKLLSYTKRYRRSIEEYRKVLQAQPKLAAARAELAQVLFWGGHKKEALAELGKLPSSDQAPETLLLRADLLSLDKQYSAAAKLYRQYLAKQPADAKARFRLAQVLSWDKHYKESLEQYGLVLKALPGDRQVRRHYALVLSWDGQFNKAIAEMERSLK